MLHVNITTTTKSLAKALGEPYRAARRHADVLGQYTLPLLSDSQRGEATDSSRGLWVMQLASKWAEVALVTE